eukprot:TRINITY_DN2861_c0_g1_i1.p1 TRINITY_DN2861_c0_g1~~TRINITY_DN2861_c0_g1_i1.p1  ORF type:complete len:2112 (+),score=650.25 TRINITY_DN2861_c0_g1_i1:34-6336(+)
MSVAEVVRKVIEELSDGVSTLMLTVIVLSEQNATVPADLPATSAAVNQTAQMLAKIANKLAGSNYKKFPPIATEIVEAAGAVDGATVTLANAINELTSAADRQAGWKGLVDACRVMAGKTIRLLQIVYGADFKRVVLAGMGAGDKVGLVDPSLLDSDQQDFANKGSAAATQAAQLAAYVKQRANEAESDLAKESLNNKALELNQKAKDFLADVNKALQAPTEASSKDNMADAVKTLQTDLDDAVAMVKEFAPEVPDSPELEFWAGRPDYSEFEIEEEDEGRHPGENHDSPFKKDLAAARRYVQKVVDAGLDQNSPDLVKATNGLKAILDDVLPRVRALRDVTFDAGRKADTGDSCATTTKNFVPLLKLSKEALDDDAFPAQQKLRHGGVVMLDALDDIEKATMLPTLQENLNELGNVLQKKSPQTQPRANALHKRIQDQGDYHAIINQNPRHRRAIHRALKDLDTVVANVDDALQKRAPTLNGDVDMALKKIDDVSARSNAAPLAAINAVDRAGDGLQHAAIRPDVPGTASERKKEAERVTGLYDAAQAAAQRIRDDPEQKQTILDAALDVQRVAAEHDKVAAALIADPENAELQGELGLVRGVLDDALMLLTDALYNRKQVGSPDQSPLKGDVDEIKKMIDQIPIKVKASPQELPPHLGDIRQLTDDVLERAAEIQVAKSDPEEAAELADTIKQIKETQTPLENASNTHCDSPTNNEAKKALRDVSNTMKGLLDDLVDQTRQPSLWEAAQALIGAIEQVQAGSPDVDNVDHRHGVFAELVKYVNAHNEDVDEKNNVLAALTALSEVLDDLRLDVTDKEPQAQLDEDAEEAKLIIQDILALLHGAALHDADDLLRNVYALARGAERGSDAIVPIKSKAVAEGADRLRESAKEAAVALPAERKALVEDAADRLPAAAAAEIAAAKSVLAAPEDKEATRALRNAVSDIEKLVNDIKSGLGHNDDAVSTIHFDDDGISDEEDEEEDFDTLDFDPSADQLTTPPPTKSSLIDDIEKLRQNGKDVRAQTLAKQPKQVHGLAEKGKKDIQDVAEKVAKLADEIVSAGDRQDLRDAMKHVDNTFRGELGRARDFLKATPASAADEKNLEDEWVRYNDALDALLAASQQPDLYENARRIQNALGDHSKPNAKKLVDAAQRKVGPQADQLGRENNAPAAKAAIRNASKAAVDSVDKFAAAVDAGRPQVELDAEAPLVNEALATVIAATNADAIAAIKRLMRVGDVVANAADHGDSTALKQASPKVSSGSTDVVATSTAAADRVSDPLQKAAILAALAEVPHATKNVVGSAASAIATPTDTVAAAGVTQSVGDMNNVLQTLLDALQNKAAVPAAVSRTQRRADTLAAIIPQLVAANEAQKAAPRDPAAKRKLVRVANKLDDKLLALTASLGDDPADLASMKAREVRNAVEAVAESVQDNDQPQYLRRLETVQALLPQLKEALAKVSPSPSVDTLLATADKIVDAVSASANASFRAPTQASKNALRVDTDALDRTVVAALDAVVPLGDEKVIAANSAAILASLANVAPNPAAAAKQLEDLKEPRTKYQRSLARRALFDDVLPRTAELNELWEKFVVGTKNGDESSLAPVREELNAITESGSEQTNAAELAPVLELEDALRGIVQEVDTAAANGSPANLQNAANKVSEKLAVVQNSVATNSAAVDAYNNLGEPIQNFIAAANTGDRTAAKSALDTILVPLSAVKTAVAPAVDRAPVEALYHAIVELNKCPAAPSAIAGAQKAVDDALNATRAIALPASAAAKAKELTAACATLATATSHVKPADPADLAYTVHGAVGAAETVIDIIQGGTKDDLYRHAATANRVVKEILRAEDEFDAAGLGQESDKLAEALEAVVASSKDTTDEMVPATASAISVPRTPGSLADAVNATAGAVDPRSVQQYPPILKDLHDLANPKVKRVEKKKKVTRPPPQAPPSYVKKGGSFEDVVDQVAANLRNRISDIDSPEANDIVRLLKQLAQAARDGNKQLLITTARELAQRMKDFASILRTNGKRIQPTSVPFKNTQNQLYRSAQSMTNLGMQMKILCSVKAATLETNKDTDEVLNNLVTDIGTMVTLGVDGLDVSRKTIFKAEV